MFGQRATYFEYFKGEGEKPSRTKERMILSASEWTGVPLAAVLGEAGLTRKLLYVRAEGSDQGVPATANPGTQPFYYDKGLPIEKAMHPDTILAGRRTASCWSTCTAHRCACWSRAGPATGRSSG